MNLISYTYSTLSHPPCTSNKKIIGTTIYVTNKFSIETTRREVKFNSTDRISEITRERMKSTQVHGQGISFRAVIHRSSTQRRWLQRSDRATTPLLASAWKFELKRNQPSAFGKLTTRSTIKVPRSSYCSSTAEHWRCTFCHRERHRYKARLAAVFKTNSTLIN